MSGTSEKSSVSSSRFGNRNCRIANRLFWCALLFDLYYYVTILSFIYLWIFPASLALCLSHGSLASAAITWRNSLVFHDLDKVTSLFIHVYPPFVFTVTRLLLATPLLKFALIDRREKMGSDQRTTTSFPLNSQRGIIGRSLSAISPQSHIAAFMGGQLVLEVFGRKLEALRKELSEITQGSERIKEVNEKVQEKQGNVARGGTWSDTTLSETASVVSSGSCLPLGGLARPISTSMRSAMMSLRWMIRLLVSNKVLSAVPVRNGDADGEGEVESFTGQAELGTGAARPATGVGVEFGWARGGGEEGEVRDLDPTDPRARTWTHPRTVVCHQFRLKSQSNDDRETIQRTILAGID
ncbi:hypothetical protein D9758_007410 [Tetrapyrgos nigripes]|uniref:Glycerophosphocholine acyltransferase 1 n=1 Tax=Tetrapyrgos nigripes TaxID=182062 RepID=A0A8H5LHS1_9AGAR|nr:hypothetical protein D9758_007410 [Tetrapyrgos nigripes]